MLILLYSTGVRITELIELEVGDCDFQQRCIKVTGKGSKERLVPVPEGVLAILEDYLQETYPKLLIKNKIKLATSYLFPTYYDGVLKPMTRQSFWMYLKKLAQTASITKNFSPHTLRHSLATHLLKNGVNLRSLQMLLGHEQLSTVQIYTHVDTSHLRKIYDKKHPRS
jgi:integrase/recombinase XerD